MKKLIAILFSISALAMAQSAPARQTYASFGTPPTGTCADASNLGSFYFELGNPANGFTGTYVCQQTGDPGKLGGGAFTWTALATQPSTPTTGTISVANGKAAVISNSITLAGTDAKTYTGPTISGGLPVVIACGSTTTGTANCANTATTNAQIYYGEATLASNAQVITISPGFTAAADATCTANDITTRANVVQCVVTNGTTLTITNTTGASDVISWMAVGF